jgi:hypothetical protein
MSTKRKHEDDVETLDADEEKAHKKARTDMEIRYQTNHIVVHKALLRRRACFNSPFLQVLLDGAKDDAYNDSLWIPKPKTSGHWGDDAWAALFEEKEPGNTESFMELCNYLGHTPEKPLSSFVATQSQKLEKKLMDSLTDDSVLRAFICDLIRDPVNAKAVTKARLPVATLPTLDVAAIKNIVERATQHQYDEVVLCGLRLLLQSDKVKNFHEEFSAETRNIYLRHKLDMETKHVKHGANEILLMRTKKYAFPVFIFKNEDANKDVLLYWKTLCQSRETAFFIHVDRTQSDVAFHMNNWVAITPIGLRSWVATLRSRPHDVEWLTRK